MTNETLRNCPFCGGKAEFDNASYDDANGNHQRFTVECCNMECIGWVFYDSKELAASAWNRRPDEKVQKLVNFLKAEIAQRKHVCTANHAVLLDRARELLKEIEPEGKG